MEQTIINILLLILCLLAGGILIYLGAMRNSLTKKQKKMMVRILLSSAILLCLQLIGAEGFDRLDRYLFSGAGRWVRLGCYLGNYLLIGYDILRKAVLGILGGQVFSENFLMAVATIGALSLAIANNGDYLEAIAVMLFYQLGEWFQGYAVGQSRKSISALMDIRPDFANIEIEGRVEQVDPCEVRPGSVILVRPGEKIPIDGVVIEGSSSLNAVALTGESIPRDVSVGDRVISGCVSMTGILKIRTEKDFGESTVSKILDLVENASSRKSRSESFITRFARIYTPAVCLGALVLAVLPPLVQLLLGGSADFGVWIYRALTFLVISCPCALVISVPLSFFACIGGASRQGILIKGSSYIESLAKTKYVVFDKTGTLTKGVFEVTEVGAETIGEEKLLAYAAHAEAAFSHPIAASLRRAYGQPVDMRRVTDVQAIHGKGVVAKVDGRRVTVGNAKLMEEICGFTPSVKKSTPLVYLALDGVYEGYIVISDQVRPTAMAAIKALKKAGTEQIVMLTGDGEAEAQRVGTELGVDTVHSQLLPEDKVERMEQLKQKKGQKDTLCFVGDGVNDAPVLSLADVGMAMGGMGSDAAIEAADIVLMDDDPMKVPKAIRISRKCMKVVHENIAFSLAVKFVCLLLGALGFGSMYMAIFADVGVMVLAVLNSMRCMFVKNL